MRKRVTLSIGGIEYEVVVGSIKQFERMNSHQAYLLRGVHPKDYPEEIREEVKFFSGSMGAGRDFDPDEWPAAHIGPECDVTVEGWETTDEPLTGREDVDEVESLTESDE